MGTNSPQKLEFHYYFNDESHTIDAVVRHKCETEILSLISEVANYLDLNITVEVEPYSEGGFLDRYKINWESMDSIQLAKLSFKFMVLTFVVNTVLNRLPVSTANPELEKINTEIAQRTLDRMRKEDGNQKNIDDEHLALNTKYNSITSSIIVVDEEKEKKKEKDKVKENKGVSRIDKDLIQYQAILPPYYNDKLKVMDIMNHHIQVYELATALTELETNPRVNRFRSNYYKNLKRYEKVIKITSTPLDENNKPIDEPVTILRENFARYIIETDELPNEIDINANIEIISPVLIKGKYKWKGFYKGKIIDFYMKDSEFKESVIQQKISFKSGIVYLKFGKLWMN